MTSPDPTALAVWHAMDVAEEVVQRHAGAPIIVSTICSVHCWPTWLRDGARLPVVDLMVLSDMVLVVAGRRNPMETFSAQPVPYPVRGGVVDPFGVLGPLWRERLDITVAVALAQLPAAGQLASP